MPATAVFAGFAFFSASASAGVADSSSPKPPKKEKTVMPKTRKATPETFVSTRVEVGRLTSELMLIRDGLKERAAKVELTAEELLPCFYRGTIETICRDLLDDAVETLVKLGMLTEEDAERRALEAVDLLTQLRAGRHDANASGSAP